VNLIRILKDVLGIGRNGKPKTDSVQDDRSTRLAIKRTDLALERNYMAAERTLMAWVRTSLAMISFGFTIGKLGEALGSSSVNLGFGRTTGIKSVAYFLVIVGTLSLLVSAVQNRVEVAALFRMGLRRRPSLAFLIAVLLGLLGTFAFTSMVMNL
jgi:putative membrane protein